MEPLYKGQVGYSGASLQGTSWIQWSLSTRDKLDTVEPLYKGQVGYSGASLQGTSWIQWSLSTRDKLDTVEPLYKGQVGDGSLVPWKEAVLFSEVTKCTITDTGLYTEGGRPWNSPPPFQ